MHLAGNPSVNLERAIITSSQPGQEQIEAMDTRTAATGQGNAVLVADGTDKDLESSLVAQASRSTKER